MRHPPIIHRDSGGAAKKQRGGYTQPSTKPGGMAKTQRTRGGVVHTVVCKPEKTVGSVAGLAKVDPENVAPKVGRNDPCPCGSGLKSKRCGA